MSVQCLAPLVISQLFFLNMPLILNPGGGVGYNGGSIANPLLAPNGSTSAPGVSFTNKTNSGLIWSTSGSNYVGLVVNATTRMSAIDDGTFYFGTQSGLGKYNFSGNGTTTGKCIAQTNSGGTTTLYTTDAGNLYSTSDTTGLTPGTSGYGFYGESYGVYMGVKGSPNGNAILLYTPTSSCLVSMADLSPYTEGTPTLGKSGFRWKQLFVLQNGVKFGDATNGAAITATGTSPNESLVLTPAGTGSVKVPAGGLTVGSGVASLNAGDGNLILAGGLWASAVTITTDLTATGANFTIFCDTTAGNITTTLPAAASNAGKLYNIKKVSVDINSVTIDPNGAELIDGAASVVFTTPQASYQIQCDGTGWKVIGLY